MKPIAVNGHSRSLTQVKYNREGDLLFSVSKDSTPSVWYSHDGSRLGTYDGHNGTVWCCSVDYTSKFLVTGSADNSLKLWDVETGKNLVSIENRTAVRSCNFSYDGQQILFTTDNTMGQKSSVRVYSLQQLQQEGAGATPTLDFQTEGKAMASLWGICDETIVTGHHDGAINIWDLQTKSIVRSSHEHTNKIMDLQLNKDGTMFVSASKDQTAKLYDLDDLEVIKSFRSERPVNSASISPIRDHVVLGGGQEAMEVTTTHGKQGKFDAKFYHIVFEEEIGTVKGHFGPINTVAFHPDGKGYTSGGEDGYMRIHRFDPSYFDFEFEH